MSSKIKIKDLPIECKPRERLIHDGAESLSNAELISIILRTGNKSMSALDLAGEVLSMSNGLRDLMNFDISDLMKISGIGEAKACQIISALELSKRVNKLKKDEKYKISCPEDIFKLFKNDVRFEQVEKFNIAMLNTKNEVIKQG